jgi:mannose-1-phosphate guanylyltransferase
VGGWEALARLLPADAAHNVEHGPVSMVNATRCIAWSDGVPIVIAGAQDIVVVSANGRILVVDRAQAANLKQVLDALPREVREIE